MTNEQRWAKMKKHERAMAVSRERAEVASRVSIHLNNVKPRFAYDAGNKLRIVWDSVCGSRSGPVIINQDAFCLRGSHPWGGNNSCALAYLAHWIRTGKMPLTYERWERWCGPPVKLGNPQFLAALYAHIYGGE